MVTYRIENNRFMIIEENTEIPFFGNLSGLSVASKKRFACCRPFSPDKVDECTEDIYID